MLLAALAVLFTVPVQGALDAMVAPAGVPAFTAGFVLVTWLFLAAAPEAAGAGAVAAKGKARP